MKTNTAKGIVAGISIAVIASGIILGFAFGVPKYSFTSSETTFNFSLMISVWLAGAVGLVLPCTLIAGVVESINNIYDDLHSLKQKSQDIAYNSPAQIFKDNSVNPHKEWLCPKCGKVNQNYVGSCGCGEQKPQ